MLLEDLVQAKALGLSNFVVERDSIVDIFCWKTETDMERNNFVKL